MLTTLLHFSSNKDILHKARVGAVGPAIFTLINTLPGIAVTTLLCGEMILASESPASGALQVLLALSPGLFQVFVETLLLYRKPLAVTPSTGPSGEARYVHILFFTVCSICQWFRQLDSSAWASLISQRMTPFQLPSDYTRYPSVGFS